MRGLTLSLIAAGALVAALPRAAHATPCDQIPGLTNPVYLQVGDTQLALMKRLGRAMRDNAARPVSMIFTTSVSCTNIFCSWPGSSAGFATSHRRKAASITSIKCN